ncbi:DUF1905 domain-containing protein [Patescibacteria group bacterium]|nr:MAG: DUF1905 domain-containing protein [Patescibacteria group bacterium]
MFIRSRSKIWLYSGDKAAWHFLTLSNVAAEKLKAAFKQPRRGWGSIPVIVQIGKSQWKTSVFPESKLGIFILPIKAKVRKVENIKHGRTVSFTIEVDRWK